MHLELRLSVTPGKATTSHQNAPQNPPSETGKQHGLASSRTAFFDLRMCDLQCQTSRPEPIKNRGFAAWGLISHLELALKCASTSDRKGFPKMRPPKQRNSMAWRAQGHRLFSLRWGDLQCQTLRPEPLKKEDFPAVGLISHLELASSCFAVAFGHSRTAKPRLLTVKASQKRWLQNSETAWPGELKDSVF